MSGTRANAGTDKNNDLTANLLENGATSSSETTPAPRSSIAALAAAVVTRSRASVTAILQRTTGSVTSNSTPTKDAEMELDGGLVSSKPRVTTKRQSVTVPDAKEEKHENGLTPATASKKEDTYYDYDDTDTASFIEPIDLNTDINTTEGLINFINANDIAAIETALNTKVDASKKARSRLDRLTPSECVAVYEAYANKHGSKIKDSYTGLKLLLRSGNKTAIEHVLAIDAIGQTIDPTTGISTPTPILDTDGNQRTHTSVVFDTFNKKQQKELLNLFINLYPAEFYFVFTNAHLGYVGEGFYLYWIFNADKTVTETLIPSITEDANLGTQVGAIVPITLANVTYWPANSAREYMLTRMLRPKFSPGNLIMSNKAKAIMFSLYALAGGYVEIIEIDKKMDEWMGAARYVPEAVLLWAAVAYYTAMQFEDTLKGVKTWEKSESLFLKAFHPYNGLKLGDRCTAAYVGFLETISTVERDMRMGYGAYVAGKQQFGSEYVGAGLAIAVAIATTPVALGTRGAAAREKFYPKKLIQNPDAFIAAEAKYNAKYLQSPIWHEAKLFLTPTLLALAPLGYIVAQNSVSNDMDTPKWAIVGTSMGIFSTLVAHFALGLRNPAKQLEINAIALADLDKRDPSPANEIVPNTAGIVTGAVSNAFDVFSRILTFAVVLMEFAPEYFDTSKEEGISEAEKKQFLMSILFLQAFILLPSVYYQAGKTAYAFASFAPWLFDSNYGKAAIDADADADQPSIDNAAGTTTLLMPSDGDTNNTDQSDDSIVTDDNEAVVTATIGPDAAPKPKSTIIDITEETSGNTAASNTNITTPTGNSASVTKTGDTERVFDEEKGVNSAVNPNVTASYLSAVPTGTSTANPSRQFAGGDRRRTLARIADGTAIKIGTKLMDVPPNSATEMDTSAHDNLIGVTPRKTGSMGPM